MPATRLVTRIKRSVAQKRYRIRIHAVRHMVEEGFNERELTEALTGESRVLEDYPDEFRCLVLGYYPMGGTLRSPLHVVVDYSNEGWIDIVTAYIPQRPWWTTPDKRGRSK